MQCHYPEKHNIQEINKKTKELSSVVRVRVRTILTERPPLVAEVSANFCRQREARGRRDGSLRPYSRSSRPEPLFFLPSSSSVVLTRLSGPCSRPTASRKNLVSLGIEPRPLTTRPQRRSCKILLAFEILSSYPLIANIFFDFCTKLQSVS
jgi:hypothetical protein